MSETYRSINKWIDDHMKALKRVDINKSFVKHNLEIDYSMFFRN